MPVTPFHFCIGAVTGGYASKWFSFRLFCFANVLIDIEALYRIPLGLYPYHHWMHSFLVAAILPTALALPVGRPLSIYASKWWNRKAKGGRLERIQIPETIRTLPTLSGAFLGGASHVFVDSIMHLDLAPFWPLNLENPFYHLCSSLVLHIVIFILGLIGLGLMAKRLNKQLH